MNPKELLTKALLIAHQSILRGDVRPPKYLVCQGAHIHHFNIPFLKAFNDLDTAMFMGGVCHVMKPNFVIAMDVLAPDACPMKAAGQGDALVVIVFTADHKPEISLEAIIDAGKGERKRFVPLGREPVEILQGQIQDLYIEPEGGYPQWLLDQVSQVVGGFGVGGPGPEGPLH